MAMYSAALAEQVGALPFWKRALVAYTLTDQSFGVAINRYLQEPRRSPAWKVTYYFGVSVPVCGPCSTPRSRSSADRLPLRPDGREWRA